MKSKWKASVAALVLIGSVALAQDAPARPAAVSASDKTASDKAANAASNSQPRPEYVIRTQHDRSASVVKGRIKRVCQHQAHLRPAHRERKTAETAGELSQAG